MQSYKYNSKCFEPSDILLLTVVQIHYEKTTGCISHNQNYNVDRL